MLCEQAYAPGLVPLYAQAGYEAIVADWDNAYRSHPEWPLETRRAPQRALGADGASLPVIWSESIAFQKFQRYAHDELDLEPYVAFVARRGRATAARCSSTPTTPRSSTTGRAASPPSRPRVRASGTASPRR